MSNATTNITVVLLHGAGTGAWVWERVIAQLAFPALALDVPGRDGGVTPDRCAAALVAELDRNGADSVVVVLHSLAGVLAPGLAARLGPRLRRIVYLGAVVPPEGDSFVDALPFINRQVLRLLFAFNRRGLRPSPAMIRRELCNDLDPEDADQVIARYTAEMPGLYLEPVTSPPPRQPAAYIKLLQDRSVPPARQDIIIKRLHHPRVRQIDAGHLAMLSASAELAGVLTDEVRAAQQPDSPNEPSSTHGRAALA